MNTPPSITKKTIRKSNKTIKQAVALYDYSATTAEELSFEEGDIVYIIEDIDENWLSGCIIDTNQSGLVPKSYVQIDARLEDPIFEAAKRGNMELLVKLVDELHADVNGLDAAGNTPLHWASRAGHLDAVEYLITKGSHVNVKNNLGDTPLHSAAASGKGGPNMVDVVRRLLISGGNGLKDVINDGGRTAKDLARDVDIRGVLSEGDNIVSSIEGVDDGDGSDSD